MSRTAVAGLIMPLAVSVAALACSSSDSTIGNPDQCNIVIAQVTPYSPTLHLNDTLTFHAAYTAGISADCIPNVPATSLRWTSSNAQYVTVDSITGTVTARAAGSASVMVHAPGSSGSLGSAQVTVTAP